MSEIDTFAGLSAEITRITGEVNASFQALEPAFDADPRLYVLANAAKDLTQGYFHGALEKTGGDADESERRTMAFAESLTADLEPRLPGITAHFWLGIRLLAIIAIVERRPSDTASRQ